MKEIREEEAGTGQTKTDKEGFRNVNLYDANTVKNWNRWHPKGVRNAGLPVQCLDCGSRDHESGMCQKERRTGPVPPYGECYICKDKTHWARDCPDRRY